MRSSPSSLSSALRLSFLVAALLAAICCVQAANPRAIPANHIEGSGEISVAGEVDWWYFDVPAGGDGQWSMWVQLGTLTDSVLSLHSAENGPQLAINDDCSVPGCTLDHTNLHSRIDYSVTGATRYWLKVRGYSTRTGTYTVKAEGPTGAPPPPPPPAGEEIPLSGSPPYGARDADIAVSGEADWFYFDVPSGAGGTWTMWTALVGTLSDSVLSLHSAQDGPQLAINDDCSVPGCSLDHGSRHSRIDHALLASTRYWLKVRGYSTRTGTCTVKVRGPGGAPPPPPPPAGGDEITLSGTPPYGQHAGDIAAANEADWYYFDVPAGCSGVWSMWVALGTLSDSVLTLHSAHEGPQLARNDDCDVAGCSQDHTTLHSRIDYSLTPGTRYWLKVRGYSTRTGTYTMKVRGPSGAPPPPPPPAGEEIPLAGSPPGGERDGEVSPAGDADWFYFDVPAGAGGGWSMWTSLGSLSDSVMSLHDAREGPELASNDDCQVPGCSLNHTSRHSRIDHALTAGTRYWLKVWGYGNQTGTYTVKVQAPGSAPPPPPPPSTDEITLSGTPPYGEGPGNIDPAGDADWYYFDVPAGAGGTWNLWVSLDTLSDSVLSLHTAHQGSTLATNDDCHVAGCTLNHTSRHSRIDRDLVAGTRYWLKVRGYSTRTGTYTVKVRGPGGAPPPPPASEEITVSGDPPGGAANGDIAVSGEEDWFYFDVPAGTGGVWRMWTALDSLGDSVLSLHSSHMGPQLAINDDCSVAGCALDHSHRHSRIDRSLAAGTRYYLKVTGYGTSTGTYAVKVQGPTAAPGGTVYRAVVAGISDYPGSSMDLDYCDDDAQEFRDALLTGSQWTSGNITVLIDSQATKSAIQTAIQNMANAADSDDVCVFFFSGHGTAGADVAPIDEADGLDEFLVPYGDYIRDDELSNWLSGLPGPWAALIDTCYSGGHLKGSPGLRSRGIGTLRPASGDGFAEDLQRLARARDLDDLGGGVIVTACDDDETSVESGSLQNGLFTYYLLQGMAGPADTSGNGWVSAEESYWYTSPRVTAYLATQHPQYHDGYTAGDLDLVD